MKSYSVKAALAGHCPADISVRIQGWVRTRRDSKAGVSFLALTDGSCFGTLQIVVPNTISPQARHLRPTA
jgi:asparaginyl-tRNA synthetase